MLRLFSITPPIAWPNLLTVHEGFLCAIYISVCVMYHCVYSVSALLVFAKGVDRIRLPAEYVITEVGYSMKEIEGVGREDFV